jgi:hypothetical protein
MESAFRTDIVGDKGQAHNICQWHEPRVTNIRKGCGVDVMTEKDMARLADAIHWELNNTHRAAQAAILKATTAADAARAACTHYEGAGAPNAAERRAADAEWWAAFIYQRLLWVRTQG